MKLQKQQLDKIETTTLGYYDSNALSFWQGTKDHDVTQNYRAFLQEFLDNADSNPKCII